MPKVKYKDVKYNTYKCTWCGGTIIRLASDHVPPDRPFCNNNRQCQRAFFADRALTKIRRENETNLI